MSTIARLAVGVRDARSALGDAFLLFPERGVAALFDLCPDDAPTVRELGKAMRSGWFVSARAQLMKGEPISESSLARPDQWIAKVFNYAYGLKGLSSEAPPAPTVPSLKKTQNLRPAAFAGAGAVVLAVILAAVFFGHGSPAPSNSAPSVVANLTPPAPQTQQQAPPQQAPARVTSQPEKPKPAPAARHAAAPKHHREPSHESHRRVRTAPHHSAPINSEPKVSVVHETPPPQ